MKWVTKAPIWGYTIGKKYIMVMDYLCCIKLDQQTQLMDCYQGDIVE